MGLPQLPPPPQLEIDQNQVQQQQQDQQSSSAQQLLLQDETTITSDAVSENAVVNENFNANYQINNNYDSYIQYRNGAKTPVSAFGVDVLYNTNNSDVVVKAGWFMPIGGKGKKLVQANIEYDNAARRTSSCIGLIKSLPKGWDIDFQMVPEMAHCGDILKQKTVIEPTVSQQIQELKQMIVLQQKTIKEQQATITAFQSRLIQIQHSVPVRVGG